MALTEAQRCDLLLVPLEQDTLAGVRERVRWRGSTRGVLIKSEHGDWQERRIVIAVPQQPAPDAKAVERVLEAAVSVHRPSRLIAIGPVVDQRRGVGQLIYAVRITDGQGTYMLDDRLAPRDDSAWVVDGVDMAWASATSRAARQLGIAVEVAGVVVDERWLRGKKNSLARRAGALLGEWWRRPTRVPESLRKQQGAWDAEERLADALERLVGEL